MSRQPLRDMLEYVRHRHVPPPFEWVVEHVDADGTLAPIWGQPETAADMLVTLLYLYPRRTRFMQGVDALVRACVGDDAFGRWITRQIEIARELFSDNDRYKILLAVRRRASAAGYTSRMAERYDDLVYHAMKPFNRENPMRTIVQLLNTCAAWPVISRAHVIADAVPPPTIADVFAAVEARP